jgi:cytochrome c oxidase cbb3-type subunit III
MSNLRYREILIAILGIVALAGELYPQLEDGAPRAGPGFGRVHFDQAAVNRGRQIFSVNCAFCHGQDARGTGSGPDLGRSLLILSDENGRQLSEFLQTGRPDEGMPAFPNFEEQQIKDIATFLHFEVQAARSRNNGAMNILVGDAKAGESYFNGPGKCSGCHSVTGDLRAIGSKYDPVTLQDTIVNPRAVAQLREGRSSDPYPRKVKVFLLSGRTVTGTLIYLSEFAVTLRDASGERQTFSRNGERPKVEVVDPLQAHQDLLMRYTDAEIHNLTAYLASLK